MRVHIGWALALASLTAGGGYTAAKQVKTPKGYIVAEVQVTDAEAYKAYVPGAGAAVAKHGGKYLVRGGQVEQLEGPPPAGRFVIVEYPSFEAARAFYHSADYQAVAPIRQKASISRFWVAEGLPNSTKPN
jgi:uncharacterized protein (DUF1330 family)